MKHQDFLSRRGVRMVSSFVLASVLLGQLPLVSLFNTPALGQASAIYNDANNGFLTSSSEDIVKGSIITIGALGVYDIIWGHGDDGDNSFPSNPSLTSNTPGLPDPLVKGDVSKPIWSTLTEDSAQRFSRFTTVAARNAMKEEPLRDSESAPYTCFAPTNTAVTNLPAAEVKSLSGTKNKGANQKTILKHIVYGKYSVRELEKLETGFQLATLAGDTVTITRNADGTVAVNGASIVREDIEASNGISHPVTSVIK